MAIFGGRNEVLDLTDLQRRGILKKSAELEKSGVDYTGDGFVDFSHLNSSGNVNSLSDSVSSENSVGQTSGADLLSGIFGSVSSSGSSGSSGGGSFWSENTDSASQNLSSAEGPDISNPLGFMDSNFSRNDSWETTKNISSGNFGSSLEASSGSGLTESPDLLEVQGLKNKIEDLEFKIDRLMEKVASLEG